MKYAALSIVIVLIFFSCSNEKKREIDFLLNQINTAPASKIPDLLDSIADGLLKINTRNEYSQFLEQTKKQTKNDNAEINISLSYLEAEIERIQGNKIEALNKLFKALPYFENSKRETTKTKVLNLIGYLFQQMSTGDESFESYLKTINKPQNLSKLHEQALLAKYLAKHFYNKNDLKKAIKYTQKKIAIYEALMDSSCIYKSKIELAEYLQETNNHNETTPILIEILKIYESSTYNEEQAKLYMMLGVSYTQTNQITKAHDCFIAAKKRIIKERKMELLPKIKRLIGDTEFNLKKWKSAKQNYLDCLEFKQIADTVKIHCDLKIAQIDAIIGLPLKAEIRLRQILQNRKTSSFEIKASAAYELSEIFFKQNKLVEANKYLKKYITLNELATKAATEKKLNKLKLQQNSNQKEQRIELLYKESEIKTILYNKKAENYKTLAIGIALIAILLLITLWLFLSGIKKNKLLSIKNDEIQEKNEELNSINNELHYINKQLIESEENLTNEIKAQDKLLSIVAHDLKSPLIALKNILGLYRISKDKFTPEKMAIAIDKVEYELSSVLELLNNLLNWAINHRGNMNTKLIESNLTELIENTISLFKEQLHAKNITIKKNILPNLTWTVDPNMIQFIIRNFITNAIKFTPDNGNINISATTDSNSLLIAVKDTGIGLDPQQLADLSRFANITPNKGTHGEKGSGIGLILCNEFAQKLNGKIIIESKLNEGSTFSLHLHPHNQEKKTN